MKKLLSKSYGIIVLICVVEFFFLCLCIIFVVADTPEYQIIKWDGKHYLIFKEFKEAPYDILYDDWGSPPAVTFDSIEELYSDFLFGNFTEEEHTHLRRMDSDKDGKIEIFNINNLMIPFHTSSPLQITLVGYCYGRLNFFFKGDISGYAYEITEQGFFDAQNEISNLPSEYDAEYDEERDVTVYHMNYGKSIVYSIVNKSKQMLVLEKYSDHSLPYQINCYFEHDGKFYIFELGKCKEELPTKEWLSQFGIQKYEG